MTEHAITYPFRKHCLATAIGLLLANPSYALQALSDDSLSNTTGEGVALVLDDFKMVFQQPNDLSTGSSYTRGLENPSQYDTGFIRIIPTGENYQNISEHTYKKVYNQVYDAEYLAGVSTTSTLYQSTYTTTFNNYKTQNYSSTKTAVSSEISVGVRQSLVAEYFESDLMQEYYQQRYNDYYDGTIITGLKNDGTTSYTLTALQENKSNEYAAINTYEMIEILYGNRSADTVPWRIQT